MEASRTHSAPRRARFARLVAVVFATVALVSLSVCELAAQSAPRLPSERDLLLMKAIENIDNGRIDTARALLAEGIRRFPSDLSFPYELAYIHYALKEYRDARTILEKLVESPSPEANYFQLLGNTHDMLGDPGRAIETYKRGLERFPQSGPLYLELGVIAGLHEEYAVAVGYWEKGIEKAPEFPSNYYHAARMYMGTTERGWGMLYGEIFLNIEPGSPRSPNTREQLYAAWNDAITTTGEGGELKEGDTSVAVSLFDELEIIADSTGGMIVPFKFYLFRSFLLAAMPAVLSDHEKLSVAALHDLRKRFIDHWYDDTASAAHFDIELFDRWRELEKAGLFEAYDHMIFYTKETQADVDAWAAANASKLRDVTAWLRDHPIGGGRARPFSRLTVGGVTMSKEALDAKSSVESSIEEDTAN